MKRRNIKMIVSMLAFMLAFFIGISGNGEKVYAFESQENAFEIAGIGIESSIRTQKSGNSNAKLKDHILYDGDGDASGSGVTELDNSLSRGKTFLVGIIHFFGAAVALFGVVFAAIGFLGRDNEQKIIGITAFIVGVAIFFAPQIVNAVVGQSVF